MRSSRYLGLCLIIGIVGLSLALYLLYDLIQRRRASVLEAKEAARQQAVTAASEIGAELRKLEAIVHRLAEEVTSGEFSDQEVGNRLTEVMEGSPELHAVGLAYAPFAAYPNKRLHAPLRVRRGGSVQTERLEDSYDYTDLEWYANAVVNGAGWDEPVWNEAEEVMMATYSEPFLRVDEEGERVPAGVAYSTVSMEPIRERIEDLELGKTGYGVVLSKQGYFLIHPSQAAVREHIPTFEIAEALNDDVMRQGVERATAGESGFIDHVNLLTGQSSWFFFEPVRESGWSAVVVRITDEILTIGRFFRRRVIWISLYSMLGLMCVAIWLSSRWYRGHPRPVLWGLVTLLSILLIAGSALIRYVVYYQVLDEDHERVTILDAAGLNAFLRSREEAFEAEGRKPPVYVPVGISVQTMKFASPTELFVTGYLWQKFPAAADYAELPRGVELPNAVDASFSEAYRRLEDGVETVGWYFRATLRQDLDISKYPFDHGTVSIRLWSNDFNRRMLLVPDLASYTLTNPTSRPGLDHGLVLSGWKISGSFFDYRLVDYGTDFGIGLDEAGFPELSFSMGLKRNLLNVAIRNMLPIAVVAIMLFSVIVTCTKDENEATILGFGPSAVMRITSALFFVVLLAHIHLRDTLQIQEVAFIEYIYFNTYLAIILTTLHSFFFSLARFDFRVVEYEESLVIKLAFWPFWLGLMFVISIVFFY